MRRLLEQPLTLRSSLRSRLAWSFSRGSLCWFHLVCGQVYQMAPLPNRRSKLLEMCVKEYLRLVALQRIGRHARQGASHFVAQDLWEMGASFDHIGCSCMAAHVTYFHSEGSVGHETADLVPDFLQWPGRREMAVCVKTSDKPGNRQNTERATSVGKNENECPQLTSCRWVRCPRQHLHPACAHREGIMKAFRQGLSGKIRLAFLGVVLRGGLRIE